MITWDSISRYLYCDLANSCSDNAISLRKQLSNHEFFNDAHSLHYDLLDLIENEYNETKSNLPL